MGTIYRVLIASILIGNVAVAEYVNNPCGCSGPSCPPCAVSPTPAPSNSPNPQAFVVCWSQGAVPAYSQLEGAIGISQDSRNNIIPLHTSTVRVSGVYYVFPGHSGSADTLPAAQAAAQLVCSRLHPGSRSNPTRNCRVINCISGNP